MKFTVISAVDTDWGIGKDGVIPWHYSEDFQWFKAVTRGHTCFMGRNTYNELATIMRGKKELLPYRRSIVFTKTPIDDSRITVCQDIDAFRDFASEENFFIGGTSIFEYGLKHADRAYITRIPGKYGCNVMFPKDELMSNFSLTSGNRLSEELIVEFYERR